MDKDENASSYSAFYKFAENCIFAESNAKKWHAKAAAKDAEKNFQLIKVGQPLAREAEGNCVLHRQEFVIFVWIEI